MAWVRPTCIVLPMECKFKTVSNPKIQDKIFRPISPPFVEIQLANGTSHITNKEQLLIPTPFHSSKLRDDNLNSLHCKILLWIKKKTRRAKDEMKNANEKETIKRIYFLLSNGR